MVPPSARANACVCALSTPRCHAFPGARVLLPALALAAPIEAILHANNARDADEDKRNGIRTLAQMLGPRASFNFYAALLAVPMAYSAVQAWHRSVLGALPLLAAPLARKLVTAFRTGDFVDLPKKTAKFQVEGWLGGGVDRRRLGTLLGASCGVATHRSDHLYVTGGARRAHGGRCASPLAGAPGMHRCGRSSRRCHAGRHALTPALRWPVRR